jgi:hypothetical protein
MWGWTSSFLNQPVRSNKVLAMVESSGEIFLHTDLGVNQYLSREFFIQSRSESLAVDISISISWDEGQATYENEYSSLSTRPSWTFHPSIHPIFFPTFPWAMSEGVSRWIVALILMTGRPWFSWVT